MSKKRVPAKKRVSLLAALAFAVIGLAAAVLAFSLYAKHSVNVLSMTTTAPASMILLNPANQYVTPGTLFKETIYLNSEYNAVDRATIILKYNPDIFEAGPIAVLPNNPFSFTAEGTSFGNGYFSITLVTPTAVMAKGEVATFQLTAKKTITTPELLAFTADTKVTSKDTGTLNLLTGTQPAYINVVTTPPPYPTGIPYPTGTPMPTPISTQCGPFLANFRVEKSCGNNQFNYVSYTCLSGYHYETQGTPSCTPLTVLLNTAVTTCSKYNNCKPTPTPIPTPYCVPVPSCMYANPACKISLRPGQQFCPRTTPTPTSAPTPPPKVYPTPIPWYRTFLNR